MSKKFLLALIFLIFVSMSIVSAEENFTDTIMVDSVNSTETLNSIEVAPLSEDYSDYKEYDEIDYYDKAILRSTKLKTTYNSGKVVNVKAVSAHDGSYTLENIRLKLTVYTKGSYKNYYAYTNWNGIAKFKVSKSALGYHKIVVSSADSYTSAKKITSGIYIKKAKTNVYAPKATSKYKKSNNFKIKVKDKTNNKIVKGVKISVKVSNKKYTLKTNSHGVASFNTKYLRPGTYKVIIKSKDSKYKIYKTSKIIIKNTVRKKTSSSSTSSSSGGGYYVGSTNSDKFHYPSCSSAKRIKSYNRITFSSRAKAINAGYSPCGICHP